MHSNTSAGSKASCDTLTWFVTHWHDPWHTDLMRDTLTWFVTHWHDAWHTDMIRDTLTWYVTQWHDAWHTDMIRDTLTWFVTKREIWCVTQWHDYGHFTIIQDTKTNIIIMELRFFIAHKYNYWRNELITHLNYPFSAAQYIRHTWCMTHGWGQDFITST